MSVVQAKPIACPEDELQNAIAQFRATLTQDQQIDLLSVNTVPGAESIMAFTAALDAENRGRKGHSVGSRVYTVLRSVRDFCEVIGTFVSSNPQIAALVWGSIRLTMQIILNYTSYYEAVCGLFMQIGQFCPVFDEYALLYADCKPLQKSLSDFHASIVLRAFSSSFDQEFQPYKDEIRRCNENVKISIDLAKAKDDKRRLIAISERSKENGNVFRAFASKANVDSKRQNEIWQQQERRRALARKKQVLDALCPYNTERLLKQSQRKRFGNTANWIFQTTEFRDWIDDKGTPFLWCLGKIGSGKSILTSSVIDHLFLGKDCAKGPVSYFFVHFSEPESLNAAIILRSFLRQSLPRKAVDLPDEIEMKLGEIVEDYAALLMTTPSHFEDVKDVIGLLTDVTPNSTPSYFVVDGFDELERSQQFILFQAFSYITSREPGARIFISCRASLKSTIPKHFASPSQILLMDSGTKSDIPDYIHGMIQEKIVSEELRVGQDSLISEIEKALCSGADGMFLWVFFQLLEICAQPSDEDIRRTIADLPRDLEETYSRILRRIVSRKTNIAQKGFPWVAASKRPLTLYELREAIAIEIGQKYTEPERLCNDINTVTLSCENLLHVDEEDGSVRFAHHTIQTFLLQQPLETELQHFHVDLKEANHFLGEICLTYLDFNDFKTYLSRKPKDIYIDPESVVEGMDSGLRRTVKLVQAFRSAKRSRAVNVNQISVENIDITTARSETYTTHPFLKYAETYWLSHSKDFQREESKTYETWEWIITQGSNLAIKPLPYDLEDSRLLEFAVDARHYALIRLILSRCLPALGIPERYFLNSIKDGDMEMFNFLLPFLRPGKELNEALYVATALGYANLVEELVKLKADVNHITDVKSELRLEWSAEMTVTPVQVASFNERPDIVDMLLKAGANLNISGSGYTPLQAAAYKGCHSLVDKLILLGADVNALGSPINGLTALQAAAYKGSLSIVNKLILFGANVNAPGSPINGMTALQAAVLSGNLKMIDVLLQNKADCRHTGVLQTARHGTQDIKMRLLEAGADSNVLGGDLLQAAASYGDLSLVDRLLTAGVDANVATVGYGSTPLQAAASAGYLSIVDRLLTAGADVNAVAIGYGSSSRIATSASFLSVFEQLLEAGADVNAVAIKSERSRGCTALQIAVLKGHIQVVERLIAAGADVNQGVDEDGQTVLGLALKNQRSDIAEILERAGAKCNQGDG